MRRTWDIKLFAAHNIVSHNSPDYEREVRFRRRVSQYFDYVIVHGELARKRVIDEIGINDNKIQIMPHGSYQGYYQNYMTRSASRRKLGIPNNNFVFLFFGNIKGYKGLEELLCAYRKIRSNRNDVSLVIAGRIFDEDIQTKIYDYALDDPSILIKQGYIEDCDVQIYFNAADIVILPYKNILTSGCALLSVAFERPIIAPCTGLIPELIQDNKQGYLFKNYEDMLKLMYLALEKQRENPEGWDKNFEFSKLNSKLRWPILTSKKEFRDIFGSISRPENTAHKTFEYRYALIRILGNDLPERHDQDQTYRNLKFQLEKENNFHNCVKIWIINRIVDNVKKKRLISLLIEHGMKYVDIPYEIDEFSQLPYCFSELPSDDWKLSKEFQKKNQRIKLVADTVILKNKNNYIINNNGARNIALAEIKKFAEWVFLGW